MTLFRSIFIVVLLGIFVSGCGWVRSLRKEIEDDDSTGKEVAEFDYSAPENRFIPPPPANVADNRAAMLAGTPVDLSGQRAKHVRVTAQNFFADNTKAENSLWADEGQNNYFFARNKLKAPGDLVTVVIEDRLRKDMVDSFRNLLPPDLRDQEIRVPGLTKEKPADSTRNPAAAPGAAAATAQPSGAGPGATADNAPPSGDDMLTGEVLERYPNGNLRIRAIKRVPFKHQVRSVEVLAIARGSDIDEQDTIKSSRFFEHKVDLYK